MELSIWLAFVAATMALLLIPGPTVLLVLSYAIGHGRRVAVATALGVALGDLVAMTASLGNRNFARTVHPRVILRQKPIPIPSR